MKGECLVLYNDFFTNMVLNEANGKPSDGVTPPDDPPDFTTDQQQDQPDAGADPNAAPPDDPNAAPPEEQPQEGDPNAEGQPEDPNAAPDDPNADPGAMDVPPQEPSPEDELQQKEDEVLAELKPDQKDIKMMELKKQYMKLNSVITSSIEKLNKASRTTYDDNMIEFILRKLLELKELSKDSLLRTFSTRTYIENQVELQRMITAFNIITNMISEISQSRIKRNEVIDAESKKGLFKPTKKANGLNIYSRSLTY